ncbi:hypothetical protein IAQ61_009641 [Plenodomus lingam]|uniref:uncharacterized protein n=1 Tax=Leptosphaeria maculans TaxID=5022 RepID=UPI003325C773|nr:hypothetical protein IAQ61_009641 [Plenodomus lingam]
MDELLPSYESVTERDPWKNIPQYLPPKDLCSAALVCRKWHKVFTSHLWGSPASHFSAENDTAYTALTRFKRTLLYVRSDVRELTHTLHFLPAHAEIYGGPHAEWLRDCLEYLPRLQCLIVNGLPFFDHASLMNLQYSSLRLQSTQIDTLPMFSLRLLDAAGCTNATSTSLAQALRHFPELVSLDLSSTSAAKHSAVLVNLKYLRNLRVLRLRGLGLGDEEFLIISQSIRTRVQSLDLSHNNLTDVSARLLLDHCIKDTVLQPHFTRGLVPPVDVEQPHGDIYDVFESPNLINHLRKTLTTGFVGSLAIEEARDVGVTHLYITKNAITVEGVSKLLRSGRLKVLDIGELPTDTKSPPEHRLAEESNQVQLPCISKCTPVLPRYAKRLKYLRVNYQIVTEDSFAEAHEVSHAEPIGGIEVAKPTPKVNLTSEPSFKVEDSAPNAPAPVLTDSQSTPIDPILSDSDTGTSRTLQECPDTHGTLPPTAAPLESGPEAIPNTRVQTVSRHNSTYYTEEQRARLDFRQSQENRLHPNMVPQVHTLVLTNVPTATTNHHIIHRLIQFIKDAAAEASIARQRAQHTYKLPPGRSRVIAENEYAHSLFALRRIVLEMAVVPEPAQEKISSGWHAYPTKSSTEDKDSEAFWEAAAHDFSFFAEEGEGEEACRREYLGVQQRLPLAAMGGLEMAPAASVTPLAAQAANTVPAALDVVQAISQFRKDRKAARSSLSRTGQPDPEVEGWWPGDVTVVRRSACAGRGELDCFGSRYGDGWCCR